MLIRTVQISLDRSYQFVAKEYGNWPGRLLSCCTLLRAQVLMCLQAVLRYDTYSLLQCFSCGRVRRLPTVQSSQISDLVRRFCTRKLLASFSHFGNPVMHILHEQDFMSANCFYIVYEQHSSWPVFYCCAFRTCVFLLHFVKPCDFFFFFFLRRGCLYRCFKSIAASVSQDNKVVLDCVDYWSSVLLQDG